MPEFPDIFLLMLNFLSTSFCIVSIYFRTIFDYLWAYSYFDKAIYNYFFLVYIYCFSHPPLATVTSNTLLAKDLAIFLFSTWWFLDKFKLSIYYSSELFYSGMILYAFYFRIFNIWLRMSSCWFREGRNGSIDLRSLKTI